MTHFLMIVNDIEWFWSHRLPLARAIAAQGWDVHVATGHAASNKRLQDMGFHGTDLPVHDGSLNPLKQIALLFGIRKAIKMLKPDIIHAITLRYAFYTGFVARLMKKRPVVLTVAGLGSLFSSESLRAKILRLVALPLLRFAFGGRETFLIFQNPDDCALMLKRRIAQESQTTIIRGSGVDVKNYAFTPMPESEKPAVVFASRLIKEKGICEFADAARRLKGKARFLVAGDVYPQNPHSIKRADIQAWHDGGVVEWLGQVEDMPGLFARASIVCLPSYYGEGVPKVLLEAMAVGRPIVTTDMPGCRETVEDGVNGMLVPPRDSAALANAIEALLNDLQKQQSFGRAGRKKAEEEFAVDLVVQKTLAVYDQLFRRAA